MDERDYQAMNRTEIEQRVKSVTCGGLSKFKSEILACYASDTGVNGLVLLGIDGYGKHTVKCGDYEYRTDFARVACEKYRLLLRKPI